MKGELNKLWIVALALLIPAIAVAQPSFSNPLGTNSSFEILIATLLELFVKISIPVLAVMIVYVGFQLVVNSDNESKRKEALESFRYVVIGGSIVIGAQVIATVIKNTIGKLPL